ncbi:ABC transporter permease [Rhizomonospora bruguierae]|uniref:ABC transporter permease n=1 Tax=Rhizomonospora bruguierae TaxID=1581705 RepID=UPI001BCB5B22|nr:hypothetical protein [Micromonospora sp. NBRC 107566]
MSREHRHRPTALLGEAVLLDDIGPPRRGRAYPTAGVASLLLLPAAVLLVSLVLWPVLRTVLASVTDENGWVGTAHFHAALNAEGAWAVVGRTLLWAVVVPSIVTLLGYVLAAATRRAPGGRWVTLVLVAPIALPLVVTGVAFHLLYDPEPRRGTLTALVAAVFRLVGADPDAVPSWLGPRLITVALMSAFVWAWVGLAVLVFRAALDLVPTGLADAVRAHGGTRRDVFLDGTWRPLLRRTVAIVFALVALATARTFDLILMMAPGSAVDDASVLAVRVWQTGGTTRGQSAALGVVWLAAVALGMLGAAWFSRQAWPPPEPATRSPAPSAERPRPGRLRRIVPPLAAVLWLIPLVVLIATSLHTRLDAAASGWWSRAPSLDSYREELASSELSRSLGLTAALAAAVTAVVLVVALLAAYALAWLAPPGAQVSGVLILASAVVPTQVVAGPIKEILDAVGLAGSVVGLGLVHVALGVPFAILLLRNALADVPPRRVREARLAVRREWSVLWRLAPATVPAVVAVCVLEFVQVWNDFVVGLLFGGPDATPLGLLLYGQARQFVTAGGPLAAGSVIASALPLVLVVVFRRQVVAGLVSGSIR